MTTGAIQAISAADYASLAPDTAGVEKELERYRRQVDDGYYTALARQWVAAVIESTPMPAGPRSALAQRVGGRGYRTNATIRRKYEGIAAMDIAQDAHPKAQERILAIVGDGDVCFVNKAALRAVQRKFMADVLSGLCPGGSLIEVGSGDLGTLVGVAKAIDPRPLRIGAADMSETRLKVGRGWAGQQHVTIDVMCAAAASALPFKDNEWDLVMTSNCLEQNRRGLPAIIAELMRVSGRYVVMIEPSFELGNPTFRRRIQRVGHVRGIPAVSSQLGHRVLRHELLPVREYMNDIAITVVAKR